MNHLVSWYNQYKSLPQQFYYKHKEYQEIVSITFFLDSNYNKISLLQRIWHIKNNNFELSKCIICGKPTNFDRNKYYSNTCSKICQNIYSKSNDVISKSKQTCLDKYGVENAMKSKHIISKHKQTCLDKYGVESISQINGFSERIKSMCLDKYGVDSYFKTDEYKKNLKQKCLEKYGTNHYTQTDEYKNNKHKKYIQDFQIRLHEDGNNDYTVIKKLPESRLFVLKCPKCNREFDINSSVYYQRNTSNHEICTKCNPLEKYFSNGEKQLANFISSIYKKFIQENVRKKELIFPYELDIYIPELNLAIEYNGLYWHSDYIVKDNYHKMKSELCNEKGIRLIHIFEDDWVYKINMIKSILQTTISPQLNHKIFARKCEIKEVNLDNTNKFLEENHINGKIMTQSICYGLYYNSELVSLMSFKGNILQRYAIKLNTTIIGGAEKLFKHYINNNEFCKIITYCDISLFTGKIYERLGFEFVRRNKPNYQFLNEKNHIRVSKQSIRKLNQGYKRENDTMPRIYNCGIDVYEYNK